ncbi:hypothetical protein [Sphaerisporangium dianthi]|uniref:Novel STAND NTPase 1 domain-containing protein n=1 Tax=Sphaerisporangium dianthi TaxID=1436120 RepID=A0ABV9CUM1_9ACTN
MDDEHVVTCAHVVNAALGRVLTSPDSPLGKIVRVEFPVAGLLVSVPPERRARVEAWAQPGSAFDGVDVAGLTLVNEPRPADATPITLAREQDSAEVVLLYGPVADRPGGWVRARMFPLVTPHRQQIQQYAQGVFVARPGFSGTPVVDQGSGQMLGLLVSTAAGREDTDVYAIPLSSVVAAWPTVLASMPPSPYKGLEAFGVEDRHLFFGRSGDTEALERAVGQCGLVALVGASGVGKSSMVQAGLIARIRDQAAGWSIVTIRPRPNLSMALAAGFARMSGARVPVAPDDLEAWQHRIHRDGLVRAAEMVRASAGSDRLLLVIDQFEEILQSESLENDALLLQLAGLAEERHPSFVAVLALREDAFGAFFVRHADFGECLRDKAIALRGMDAAELAEAVRAPAALRGVTIADRLEEKLVRAVAERPGALPLLEFSLDQMWRALRPGQKVLSFDAYEEIGGLDGALAAHADVIFQSLNDAERVIVPRLFLNHLISPEQFDIRRVARRADIPPGEWPVVVALANERLLTISRREDGDETVEVVHEALLRAWDRLHTWLDAEKPFREWRRQLHYAMEPQPGEDDAEYLTGSMLAASLRWLEERPTDVNLEERRFIEASGARRDEDEYRYRLLYRRSLARTLAAAAETVRDEVLSLLLAVEALERSSDAATDRLVRSRLRRLGGSEIERISVKERETTAFTRARNRLTLDDWGKGPSPADHWKLGGDGPSLWLDGRGRVSAGWADEEMIGIPMSAPAIAVAYSPDVRVACLATEEAGELLVCQITDVVDIIGRRTLGIPVTCVALNDGADLLAVGCDDHTVRFMHAAGGLEEVARMPCAGFIQDVDISADGRRGAALTHGRITIWDLVAVELEADARGDRGDRRVVFTNMQDHVIIGSRDLPVGRIPISGNALAVWARRVAGRSLTPEEWRRYAGSSEDMD